MIDPVPAQLSGRGDEILAAAGEIGGLAVVAAAVAGGVAITYRWYARERVSNPPAVLLAIATVAAYLNATTALGQVMGGRAALSTRVALFNVSALLVGTLTALVGIAVGDRLARTVLGGTETFAVDASLGRVVRAVGRVIAVELPAEIEDVPGYDPVDSETKAALEGKTFVFPRGLTVEELQQRLTRRLQEDYRVGHVDVEITDDATVEHLGIGSRAAGIGPTLPPESAAVAIIADPAYAAAAGDLVQVWSRDPQRRLLNAEVRGTAGEVVTIAIDAADASKIDPGSRYKLVTLPVEERSDRELTELLRAAEETLGVVEIGEGSSLEGVPVAALGVTVVAVHAGKPEDHVIALPEPDRVLSSGDSVYVVARPDEIRRIEAAADGPAVTSDRPSGTMPDDDRRPIGPTSEEATADPADSDEPSVTAEESVPDAPPDSDEQLTEGEQPDRGESPDTNDQLEPDQPSASDGPSDRDESDDPTERSDTGESTDSNWEFDGDEQADSGSQFDTDEQADSTDQSDGNEQLDSDDRPGGDEQAGSEQPDEDGPSDRE